MAKNKAADSARKVAGRDQIRRLPALPARSYTRRGEERGGEKRRGEGRGGLGKEAYKHLIQLTDRGHMAAAAQIKRLRLGGVRLQLSSQFRLLQSASSKLVTNRTENDKQDANAKTSRQTRQAPKSDRRGFQGFLLFIHFYFSTPPLKVQFFTHLT